MGWGALLGDLQLAGHWTPLCRRSHINVLELWAMFSARRRLLSIIRGHLVLVQSDNATVASYLLSKGYEEPVTVQISFFIC